MSSSRLPARVEIRRIGSTGFVMLLDGEVFPWYLHRDKIEVTTFGKPDDVWSLLKFEIVVGGPVVGAEEYNERMDEEADQARVRSADREDLMSELGLLYNTF